MPSPARKYTRHNLSDRTYLETKRIGEDIAMTGAELLIAAFIAACIALMVREGTREGRNRNGE